MDYVCVAQKETERMKDRVKKNEWKAVETVAVAVPIGYWPFFCGF